MSSEYDLKLTFPLDWEKIIGFTLSLCVNKAPLAPSGFRFCLVNDFKFLTLIHLDYDLVFSPCRIFMEDTVPDQPRLPSKKHSATVYTQKEFLMMQLDCRFDESNQPPYIVDCRLVERISAGLLGNMRKCV